MSIDWTAVAAGIALFIWAADKWQRSGERGATRKLLAQIMTSPIGNARLEVVKLRTGLAERDGKQLLLLSQSAESRKELWNRVQSLSADLPDQFYDKADIFNQNTTTKLAAALSSINELRSIVRLTHELTDGTTESDMYNHIKLISDKVLAADAALERAFDELVKVAKQG